MVRLTRVGLGALLSSVLAVTLVSVGVTASYAAPAAATSPAAPRASAGVTHRVVWDLSLRRGIKLMSANVDGSDPRVVFAQRKGYALDLALSPGGSWVALAPFDTNRRASLVIAKTAGGTTRNLLADTRRFDSVYGVGWSPDGKRLVFDAVVGDSGPALWTIRRDGTGLRKLYTLRTDDSLQLGSTPLVWTTEGIIFRELDGIVRLTDGVTHPFVRGAFAVTRSGDGQWVFVERTTSGANAHSQLLKMHPDGSARSVAISHTRPHGRLGDLLSSHPSYDGSTLLTLNAPSEGGPFAHVHPSDRAPHASDPELSFLEGYYNVTWN